MADPVTDFNGARIPKAHIQLEGVFGAALNTGAGFL